MVDIICLARQTSSRFPNKIFADLNGKSVIQTVIDRLQELQQRIIFAIPENQKNRDLKNFLIGASVEFIQGPESDVLLRFIMAADTCDSKYVQRFNCDNVDVDTTYLQRCMRLVEQAGDHDLFTNVHCTNHSGQSVEIVKRSLCKITSRPSVHEQEHVFPYFYARSSHPYRLPCPARTTIPLDTRDDLFDLRSRMSA